MSPDQLAHSGPEKPDTLKNGGGCEAVASGAGAGAGAEMLEDGMASEAVVQGSVSRTSCFEPC